MFALGVLCLIAGYAGIYTGIANIKNGGQGPTFSESLGFKTAIAPPGADKPNLTGQPATTPNVGTMSGSRSL